MQQSTLAFSLAEGWCSPLPAGLDGPRTLVLVFGSPEALAGGAGRAALHELGAAFPRSVIAGCSSAGEILAGRVHDRSLSVVVARFEHTALAAVSADIDDAAHSAAVGAALAARLAAAAAEQATDVQGAADAPGAAAPLRAVLLLSDGLCVNGSALVEGLAAALPAGVVVTGGLAGDGARFARTWVLDGAVPRSRAVVAVGLYGQRLRVGHGCDGGWDDFGPERRITRAEGNVLYELDGKPALDLYRLYLGELAAGLPGTALLFPLAVRRERGGEPLVRTILAIDEASRSMTFAGDIPPGGVARLMRARTERLIDSAGQAAAAAFGGLGARGDTLAVTVSCVGRRLMLGERTEEEVEAVLGPAPPGCAHVGFYSYGEIAPSQRGRASELHNQTLTVTAFAEA